MTDLGYLRQPHTSAGRIPSDLGYRYYVDHLMTWDRLSPGDARVIVDPNNATRRKIIPDDAARDDLLVPIFREGSLVYDEPPLTAIQARTPAQLARLHAGTKRLLNPHEYAVGLEPGLFDLKTRLILKHRSTA